jgi:serine/threonine protein phosphatase PrpC
VQKTVANPTKHNFHIGHATDSSGVGQHNSDAYLIFPSITGRNAHKSSPTWYALVADGLGNDRGSYVASQLAVESTYQVLTQSIEPKISISRRLEEALQHANIGLR